MGTHRYQSAVFRARRARHIHVRIGHQRFFFAVMVGAAAFLLTLIPANASSISPADPCLHVLSSRVSSGLPGNINQRSAGLPAAASQAARLSLLLGVRHAIGPAEDLQIKESASLRGDISALDIARYRTCKKEQALTLSSLH